MSKFHCSGWETQVEGCTYISTHWKDTGFRSSLGKGPAYKVVWPPVHQLLVPPEPSRRMIICPGISHAARPARGWCCWPARAFPTLNVRRFSSVLQPWLLCTARAVGGNEACLGLLTIWDKSFSPGGPEGTWERSRREEACSWQLRTTALYPGGSTQKALCGSVQWGASDWVLGQKARSGRDGELWIKPAV